VARLGLPPVSASSPPRWLGLRRLAQFSFVAVGLVLMIALCDLYSIQEKNVRSVRLSATSRCIFAGANMVKELHLLRPVVFLSLSSSPTAAPLTLVIVMRFSLIFLGFVLLLWCSVHFNDTNYYDQVFRMCLHMCSLQF
jgi:hypothetical protein